MHDPFEAAGNDELLLRSAAGPQETDDRDKLSHTAPRQQTESRIEIKRNDGTKRTRGANFTRTQPAAPNCADPQSHRSRLRQHLAGTGDRGRTQEKDRSSSAQPAAEAPQHPSRPARSRRMDTSIDARAKLQKAQECKTAAAKHSRWLRARAQRRAVVWLSRPHGSMRSRWRRAEGGRRASHAPPRAFRLRRHSRIPCKPACPQTGTG
jgi:hypothetical protein